MARRRREAMQVTYYQRKLRREMEEGRCQAQPIFDGTLVGLPGFVLFFCVAITLGWTWLILLATISLILWGLLAVAWWRLYLNGRALTINAIRGEARARRRYERARLAQQIIQSS